MPTVKIPATATPGAVFQIPDDYQATVTVSGQWTFDPGRSPCGAGGVGGPVNDGSFPVAGAPIGCLCWFIAADDTGAGSQDVSGWFTSDNPTIVFGGTSPGNGTYYFQMNDNNKHDNSGTLTMTYDIEPKDGGVGVSDAEKLKRLQKENAQLVRLVTTLRVERNKVQSATDLLKSALGD